MTSIYETRPLSPGMVKCPKCGVMLLWDETPTAPAGAAMTREFSAFMSDLVREYTQPKVSHSGKWEWWADGRKRTRTICVRLCPDTAELTISHRGIGTNGCMSELNAFSCDVEHLPKLIHALNRAFAVARSHRRIDQAARRP